jgi:nitroimidazol reductase NimA-like FMN-containing flavoprotein (pyridoxamine 5'-phosphate oxidase superfamily)
MVGKLTDEEVVMLIRKSIVARLGCSDGERTYVVPITFGFFTSYFLCYSLEGMKVDMLRKNPNVCLEIDDIEDFYNWSSVVVFGTFEEIKDEAGIAEAKRHLSDITIRKKADETPLPPEATRPQEQPVSYKNIIYYKIHITEMTGRFEKQLT